MCRNSFRLLAAAFLIAAALVLTFSFSLSALAAVVFGFLGGYLLFRASAKHSASNAITNNERQEAPTTEIFALGNS